MNKRLGGAVFILLVFGVALGMVLKSREREQLPVFSERNGEQTETAETLEDEDQPAEEPEMEDVETDVPALKDVSWEYGEEMGDPCALQFLFSDGTMVGHFIESDDVITEITDITYRDINGDRIDEVFVGAWFMCNTVGDYHTVYVYQIQDGAVVDISPDLDQLSGTSGHVWSTELSQDQQTILTSDSFVTFCGVGCRDAVIALKYGFGGWEIQERMELLPDWKAAYLSWLDERMRNGDMPDQWELVYVDGDDIPELVYSYGQSEPTMSILIYGDGEVKEYKDCFDRNYGTCYREKDNFIMNICNIMGRISISRYWIADGELQSAFIGGSSLAFDEGIEGEAAVAGEAWEWNGETLSGEEEFFALLDALRLDTAPFFENESALTHAQIVDRLLDM